MVPSFYSSLASSCYRANTVARLNITSLRAAVLSPILSILEWAKLLLAPVVAFNRIFHLLARVCRPLLSLPLSSQRRDRNYL